MAVFLPVNGTAVAVDPASTSLDDLLRCLRSTESLQAWLAAAEGLLSVPGREADFEALLNEAVEREPAGDVFPHVQALCSLAEFTLHQAAAERDRRQRQLLYARVTELCHRAQRLSLGPGLEEEQLLPELVMAQAALAKVRPPRRRRRSSRRRQAADGGWRSSLPRCSVLASHSKTPAPHPQGDVASARKGFEKALRLKCNGRPSVAAQLALAALHFGQQNYLEALRL